MNETDKVQEPTEVDVKRPRFYSPWMLVVLVVFAACECFLFVWGYATAHADAAFYARAGLFFAFLFFGLRCFPVSGGSSPRNTLLVLLILAAIVMVLIPLSRDPREYCRRLSCTHCMKQLGLALQSYGSNFGHFPPAFVADESGKPMHSWRTLLLQFLERSDLHDAYDFKQPWNAPENQALAERSPIGIWQCQSIPDLPNRPEHRTDYVAVVGDDTLWPTDGTSRSFNDITAGTSNTAMMIEVNNSDIPWHEPRDVKLDDLLSGKLSWSESTVHLIKLGLYGRSVFYEPERGRNVLFADGSVRLIHGDLTADQIRRLFSITEPFDVEAESICGDPRPIVFRHVVFYVWLATLFLQLIYAFFPITRPAPRDKTVTLVY